jgi:hypothetical protein
MRAFHRHLRDRLPEDGVAARAAGWVKIGAAGDAAHGGAIAVRSIDPPAPYYRTLQLSRGASPDPREE